jgi:hypothetical protein
MVTQALHSTHEYSVLDPAFKDINIMRSQEMPANSIGFAIDS